MLIRFFKLAVTFDFVADAMAAESAERLALVTKSYKASQDASQYRRLGLQRLEQAMQSFSRNNADAILCALLTWRIQAPDWLV